MARYPSRTYISPRTRLVRRLYFAVAVLVIVVVSVFGLIALSDKEPEDSVEVTKKEPPKPEVTPEPQPQPKPVIRYQVPLKLDPPVEKPRPVPVKAEPIKIEPVKVESAKAEPVKIEPQPVGKDPLSESYTKAGAVIKEAKALIKKNEVIKAREMLNELLGEKITKEQRAFIKKQLSLLADIWLFSGRVYPNDNLVAKYKVLPGQYLSDIGLNNRTPWEILVKINDNVTRPEYLKAGQTIKVIKGPFHAKVYRKSFRMDLYLQGTFVRSFPIGIGKYGKETPTGMWIVESGGKMIKPSWYDEESQKTYDATDPDYPLGSRWIGLEGKTGETIGRTGFAIHGTKDPNEIGKAASRGCIRLYNGDVILVYDLMMPNESKVVVQD